MTQLSASLKAHWENNRGCYYIILGELFSSWMLVATKILEQDQDFDEPITSFQILFIRMTVTYLGCLIYMYRYGIRDFPWGPPNIRWALVARGVFGFLGILGMYYSLTYLSVSDVVSIGFLTPIVTSLMAFVLLKERFTKFEGIGCAVSLIGVLLIAKPTFLFGNTLLDGNIDKNVETVDPNLRAGAVIVSILGVLCGSTTFISVRYIGDKADPVLTISYYASITTIITFFTILLTPSLHFQWPHTLKHYFLFTLIGVSGFILQFCFTIGLQTEKASRAAVMTYVQIVFGIIWEILIWSHFPNIWSFIGITIILGSSVANLWYKDSLEAKGQPVSIIEDDEEDYDEESAPSTEVHIGLEEFETK